MSVSTFANDPTIGDNEIIWRRIHENQVVDDNNLKRKRPSTACFQDGSDGYMSVYIASEALSSQAIMQGVKEHFLASLSVGFIRQFGLGITRDPSSGGPGHAILLGKKTGSIQNQMAKTATWVEPYAP